MTFYLILLFSLVGIGLLLKFISPNKSDTPYLIITFIILLTISSIRFAVGYDYFTIYTPAFNEVVELGLSEIVSSYFVDESEYVFVGRHEFGYVLLEYIISLFSSDFRVLYFVNSFIILFLVCLFFHKYAKDKVLAIFLYICLGLFYSSLNFIRQNIAALIVSFAIMQIKDKNWKMYFPLVFLASLFHQGALIMIPFYFVLQIRLSKIILALYSVATICFLFFSNNIINFVVERFFPWYNNIYNLDFILLGIPLYYLVVPVVTFLFILIFSRQFQKDGDYILVNVAFFNMFIYLLGAKHFIIERFSLFFQFVIIIAIIALIDKIKDYNYYNLLFAMNNLKSKIHLVLPYFLVITFGLWLNYILLSNDGHSVVPYKTIFGDLYQWYTRIS